MKNTTAQDFEITRTVDDFDKSEVIASSWITLNEDPFMYLAIAHTGKVMIMKMKVETGKKRQAVRFGQSAFFDLLGSGSELKLQSVKSVQSEKGQALKYARRNKYYLDLYYMLTDEALSVLANHRIEKIKVMTNKGHMILQPSDDEHKEQARKGFELFMKELEL